jgi:hypothetical protein
MANKIPLDQVNLKVIMENDKQDNSDPSGNKNILFLEHFELIILEDTDFSFKFSNY